MAARDRKRVLVLGGGSGGLELASALANRSDLSVTLVDRTGAHLWKPRLHEFAAGTVSSSLAELSFYTVAELRGFRFEQGRVEAIDRVARTVRLGEAKSADGRLSAGPRHLPYDLCVVALGGITADFGTPGVAEHAIRLDGKADADAFRDRYVTAMIGARETKKPAKIVIVGSGATGTELAAHLRNSERAFFEERDEPMRDRYLDITILEAAPVIMPGSPDNLRKSVENRLKALDIGVRTKAKIAEVTEREVVTAEGERIPADITVWAAGLLGHPALKSLADFDLDKKGRIVVDDRLRSSVDPSVFVLGDAASFTPAGAEAPLPPTAQCASQQAAYLADAIPKHLSGHETGPFVYRNKGQLISLAQAGSVGRLTGLVPKGDLLVQGNFATAAYHSLQRQHQWSVLGPLRGSVAILSDILSPTKGPALKLHG